MKMTLVNKFGVAGGIAITIAGLMLAIGWVMNISKLVSCDWAISAEEVLRVVGIFISPLGGVLGWIGHF